MNEENARKKAAVAQVRKAAEALWREAEIRPNSASGEDLAEAIRLLRRIEQLG